MSSSSRSVKGTYQIENHHPFLRYSIFLSAFMMFQLQPVIARYILPWYGGTAFVWSTCILFFQLVLLAGYGYSHYLVNYLKPRKQIIVHLSLLVLTLLFIPITPKEWMRPSGSEMPVLGILRLLTLSIGMPFFMVSTTSPLIQSWAILLNSKLSPYPLYSLSNLGSLLGLISYPILIEPNLSLKYQTWLWSAGYVVFIVLCAAAARLVWNTNTVNVSNEPVNVKKENPIGSSPMIWGILSFLSSAILLSITNRLIQDLTVVPFLWVVPLSLYLLSFILAFGKTKLYSRTLFLPLLVLFVIILLLFQVRDSVFQDTVSVGKSIFVYSGAVFVICMMLHGELSLLKPASNKLTLYYFMISAGGAVGAIFINIVAPQIFNEYWEIYITLAGCIIYVLYALLKTKTVTQSTLARNITLLSGGAMIAGIFMTYKKENEYFNSLVLESRRNFFGVLKVAEEKRGTPSELRALSNGNVTHGMELMMNKEYRRIPLSYYSQTTGIGMAFTAHPNKKNGKGLNVGLIGLGAGTLSAYGDTRDHYKYYEINPNSELLAKKYFKFIEDCNCKTEVIIGDARISLERELAKTGSNKFDILVVDAFTGDAIPVHLINQEAMALYLKHLNPDGILAFHISNRYINLNPVIAGLGKHFGIGLYYFATFGTPDGRITAAEWALFTKNPSFISDPKVRQLMMPMRDATIPVYWTDDFTSVFPLLK